MDEISVVIPVMNEEEKIGQCLEAVLSQSLKPHEVIVVDGHLTDGTFGHSIKQRRNNNNTKEVSKIG